MNDIQAIDKAAELLLAAKNTERLATAARIRAESELLELVTVKAEGSITTKTAAYKVTTTGVVNRSIDQAALAAIRSTIPEALFDQAIRYKPELITAGVRYLQANEPDVYGALAQAFTAKPGKTSVVVERIETQLEQAA